MADDDDFGLHRPLVIFGRDVTKIPCFRSSVLYGAGSGVTAALLVFMLTSKPRLASHAAVGTYFFVSIGTFVVCRHRFAQQKFNMGQIRGAYEKGLILDGTEHATKLQKAVEVEVVDV